MIYIHWPALERPAVTAFLPPIGRADQGCECVCVCACVHMCACSLLAALMHCDRDEWSWTTLFQQRGVLRVASRGTYLHKKATREETEELQVRREGRRSGKRGAMADQKCPGT